MPLVKFVSTPSPEDNTEQISLSEGRMLVRGGDAVEVTATEMYAISSNGYQLELVDGSPDAEALAEPTTDDVALPYDPSPTPTDLASSGA